MNRDTFEQLIGSIFAVKDTEILCTEFFDLLPQFVDRELAEQDAATRFPKMSQHLHQCPECNEVYLALLDAARETRDPESK